LVCFCRLLVFCAGGPAAGVHFLTRALLAEIRADGKEPIVVGKVDQKRARGDILAADLAIYLLNGRYLLSCFRAPGLIFCAFLCRGDWACASRPLQGDKFIATAVGVFASMRLNSLEEMGSGAAVVDMRGAYFEAPWWSVAAYVISGGQ
jgi:hypothetical protein